MFITHGIEEAIFLGRRVLTTSHRAFGAAPLDLPPELEPVAGAEKVELRVLRGARYAGSAVAGAAGNYEYFAATKKIQTEIATGTSLTVAMQNADVFPNMVVQMVSIGEEAGSLDAMLSKVADFYEAEVDDAVEALQSLMEPIIMVVLGTLIGGMVVAMYLPIFKMGQVV